LFDAARGDLFVDEGAEVLDAVGDGLFSPDPLMRSRSWAGRETRMPF